MAGEMVRFPSNGGEAEGYLAKPASGSGPGVVVIQEWWGLVPHIKDVCDRLAGEGIVALGPDLYHGKSTAEPDKAGKLMMGMNVEQAAKDMSGAVDYLVGLDAATGDKVGCVGYCMGGGLSLWLASIRPQVGACVVYYGVLPPGAEPDYANLAGPVLGHFAENDAFASPAAAKETEGKIKAAGQPAEVHIYPGTEHGFFNDTRPDVHKPDEAKQSWERTLAFFREHLG